jgi:hypothetical protein
LNSTFGLEIDRLGFEQSQRPDHTRRVRLVLEKMRGSQMGFISGMIGVSFDHSYLVGAAFDRESIEEKDSRLDPD